MPTATLEEKHTIRLANYGDLVVIKSQHFFEGGSPEPIIYIFLSYKTSTSDYHQEEYRIDESEWVDLPSLPFDGNC